MDNHTFLTYLSHCVFSQPNGMLTCSMKHCSCDVTTFSIEYELSNLFIHLLKIPIECMEKFMFGGKSRLNLHCKQMNNLKFLLKLSFDPLFRWLKQPLN